MARKVTSSVNAMHGKGSKKRTKRIQARRKSCKEIKKAKQNKHRTIQNTRTDYTHRERERERETDRTEQMSSSSSSRKKKKKKE